MTKKSKAKAKRKVRAKKAEEKQPVQTWTLNCLRCSKDFESEDKKKNRLCKPCKTSIERSNCSWGAWDGPACFELEI